jgi:hypothetical protein
MTELLLESAEQSNRRGLKIDLYRFVFEALQVRFSSYAGQGKLMGVPNTKLLDLNAFDWIACVDTCGTGGASRTISDSTHDSILRAFSVGVSRGDSVARSLRATVTSA